MCTRHIIRGAIFILQPIGHHVLLHKLYNFIVLPQYKKNLLFIFKNKKVSNNFKLWSVRGHNIIGLSIIGV